jgi:KipI family sensor histidine kinase inhibitor
VELIEVGERGLLVQLDDAVQVHAALRWVRAQSQAGTLDELVPASTTLLLLGPPASLRAYAAALPTAALADRREERAGRTVEVPVVFDGDDLPEVAERTGLTVAEVVDRLTQATYTVDFFGFSPGQPYLAGVAAELRLPRRSSPRTRVPPGSLGIANQYATIYPRASPGGWSLVGRHAGPPLWDSTASPPNAIDVGDLVVLAPVSRP